MTRCVILSGGGAVIDTDPFVHCECQRIGNRFGICQSALSLEEQGKKVCLSPRQNEEAKAVVLDGCVFIDNNMKCDALFLFKRHNLKVVALVELKGAGDIPHAFSQLAYTQKHRAEYRQLVQQLKKDGPGQLKEKAFIVSNGVLSKPEKERLENEHGMRVSEVIYSEPGSKVPDLRDWF